MLRRIVAMGFKWRRIASTGLEWRKIIAMLVVLALLGGNAFLTLPFGQAAATEASDHHQAEYIDAVNKLNDIRRHNGLRELTLDPSLTRAAQHHADYLKRHGKSEGYSEDPSKEGFTGKSSQERAVAAGFDSARSVSEKIYLSPLFMGSPVVEEFSDVIEMMLESPEDRLSFLSPSYDRIGFGYVYGAFIFMFGRAPDSTGSPPVMYPYDGQLDVKTYYMPSGGRFPLGKFGLHLSGFVISFTPETDGDQLQVEEIKATLVNGKGEDVPFFHEYYGTTLFLYPKESLLKGHTYTVTMTYGEGKRVSWSFRTSGGRPASELDGLKRVHLYGGISVKGTTMLPMRDVFEQLGAKITWDNKTKTVTAQKANTTVVLQVDSREAMVNGQSQQLPVAAQMFQSKTMVPLRFASEVLGADVLWDQKTRVATVRTAEKELLVHVNASKISETDVAVHFTDPVVEKLVRDKLYRHSGTISQPNPLYWKYGTDEPVTQSDMAHLISLQISGHVHTVKDLNGLEYAKNLRELSLTYTEVNQLGPLGLLPSLEYLDARSNQIYDIHPLTLIPSLKRAELDGNAISDYDDAIQEDLLKLKSKLDYFSY